MLDLGGKRLRLIPAPHVPNNLGEHRHGGGLEVREAVQGRDDPATCWASSVTFSTGHDERGDPVGDAAQS